MQKLSAKLPTRGPTASVE